MIGADLSMSSANRVRSGLEARALAQFDSLVRKGEIFWEPTEEVKCAQQPFDVYFRISPITTSKPYNPRDKSRKPGFLDDDPEFTLCEIEPAHKLILNKYCWLRPQMILHTREFRSQRDLLNKDDFEASISVLEQLGNRYMVIFNGGPDAGSSVAHKHLQVFLRPDWKTVADEMVEGRRKGGSNLPLVLSLLTKGVADLPFKYQLDTLPERASAARVYDLYQSGCEKLSITAGVAHSLILVRGWLLLMPRACATIRGEIKDALMQGGANAMIGMLWLKTHEQFENWKTYGPMKVLKEFGVQ